MYRCRFPARLLLAATLCLSTLPVFAGTQKGAVILATDSSACDATTTGTMRYVAANAYFEFCDGTDWRELLAGGGVSSDPTPDAFSFTDVTDQSLSALIISNTLTITGFDGPLLAEVSGSGSPQLSINGGAWATAGNINPGDTLRLRQLSSASVSTATVVAVTVGASTDNWSVTTRAGQLRMFMTAGLYTGNLGGVAGADAICQSEAGVLGYSGTWKAVLSDGSAFTRDRLTLVYPIVRANDTSVVIESTNLWAASLENVITTANPAYVFTGTNNVGASCAPCSAWTDDSGGSPGDCGQPAGHAIIGLSSTADGNWISATAGSCAAAYNLYCIEQ